MKKSDSRPSGTARVQMQWGKLLIAHRLEPIPESVDIEMGGRRQPLEQLGTLEIILPESDHVASGDGVSRGVDIDHPDSHAARP